METQNILRSNIAFHVGYQLQNIAVSSLNVKCIEEEMGMKAFRRIPHKISAFLKRALIRRAWKSNCFGGPLDYYLVQSTDGTIFHLTY